MTMAPDPHAPHPCRAFDDPEFTMPQKPSRISVQLAVKPRARPPSRLRRAAWVVVDTCSVLFALAAFGASYLVFFADDRTRNAWGLWFRNITGG